MPYKNISFQTYHNLIGLHNIVSNLKYHDDCIAFSTVLPAELCFHRDCGSGAVAAKCSFDFFCIHIEIASCASEWTLIWGWMTRNIPCYWEIEDFGVCERQSIRAKGWWFNKMLISIITSHFSVGDQN